MIPPELLDAGAEMSVAATLARSPTSWEVVAGVLTEEMFGLPEARRVFAVMATVLRGLPRRPSDTRALTTEELRRSGTLQAEWVDCLPPLPPSELREAALRISDLWVRRLMAELARVDDDQAEAVLALVWEQIARLRNGAARGLEPYLAGKG